MPVDESLFDRDVELLRKRHGPDAIVGGDEMLEIERIPVSSPSIMRITAGRALDGTIIGGIPIGRITRIYGDSSTGKTMLCWDIIKHAQQYRSERFPNGLSCVYWNVEKQYDRVLVERRGVDVTELKIENSEIIEDIAGDMDLLLASRHLHVIDSASFAEPLEELVGKKDEKDPQYQIQVGAHARAWKRAINRIHHRMDQTENVVVIIDHIGFKNVANGRAQVEVPLSGNRMRYRSDLSLHLKAGSFLYYDKHHRLATKDMIKEETGTSPEGQKAADGQEISVIVAKSRVCRPLRTAKMRFDLRKLDFDHAFEYADFSIYYDADGELAHHSKKPPIVHKNGNFYLPPGYKKQFNGVGQLCDAIDADPMLHMSIRASMMRE